ncbi:hypothetical protein WJX82_000341 [Trebouxia sp. C0006]
MRALKAGKVPHGARQWVHQFIMRSFLIADEVLQRTSQVSCWVWPVIGTHRLSLCLPRLQQLCHLLLS